MAHEALEIIQLEAISWEALSQKNLGRRDDPGPLERAEHPFGHLGGHVFADMNAKLLLLLGQQQPMVGVPLDRPALLLGLFIRPAAAREERAQKDLTLGVEVLLLADALAIDGSQVGRPTAGVVELGIGREVDDKGEDDDCDDDRSQPGLMLSKRPKHNVNLLKECAP